MTEEELHKLDKMLTTRCRGDIPHLNHSLTFSASWCSVTNNNVFVFSFFLSVWLQVDNRNKGFAEKLETLLHRAYHLQEDFGSSIPPDSLLADFGTQQDKKSFTSC